MNNYLPCLSLQTIEFLKKIITPESLVFETGAGNSTIWFGKQVRKIVSLEDDRKWYEKVQGFIKKENLQNVKLYLDSDYPGKQYKHILPKMDLIEYDIVLHDGPYNINSRIAAMKFIYLFVKAGGYLIIDDTHKKICRKAIKHYLDILGWKKTDIPPGCDPFGAEKSAVIYQRPVK